MKPPGAVAKPFHQDSAYFPIAPMDLVTCWAALDEVTEGNGCVWVQPGSHREGLREHGAWRLGDQPDRQIEAGTLDRAREEAILLPEGGCSFHHSLLVHRSGPNQTSVPRRGLAGCALRIGPGAVDGRGRGTRALAVALWSDTPATLTGRPIGIMMLICERQSTSVMAF